MRFFFRSRQFRVIVSVFIIVVIIAVTLGCVGRRMTPYSDVVAIVTAPIRKGFTFVGNKVKDLSGAIKNGNELLIKNNELSAEIDELRKQISDYDTVKSENEFYKNYLGIKETNPDFVFAPAGVISRDSDDAFCGFVINKGSSSDISLYDPVITDSGLVGYITEVGTTTSKVTTILSPEITFGALDSRTDDSGIISGNPQLADKGLCKLSNLSRSSGVAIGDYIRTSGEGIFPEGILVGSVKSIGSDEYVSSIYADITPFVNFKKLTKVMVITSFEGQGGIAVAEGKN